MPIKRIQFPDGSIKRVEVPDGATDDQILQFVQSQYQAPQESKEQKYERIKGELDRKNGTSGGDPTAGMSGFDKFAAGFGKSLVDTGEGIGQLFGAVDTQDVERRRAQDAALMDTGAGQFGNIVGQGVQMAAPIPAGAAIKATSWAGKAAPYVGAAARAGAFGAAQGVGDGESRVARAGQSAALGMAGQGIASAAGGLARGAISRAEPYVAGLANKAGQLGVKLGVPNISENPLVRTVASQMERLPFSGSGKRFRNNQEAFNREVGKEIGIPNAKRITPDVFADAKARIGQEFNDLSARNSLDLTTQHVADLRAVIDEATRLGGKDMGAQVRAWADDLLSRVDQNGKIPGAAYKSFDSKAGKAMAAGGEKAMYLGSLRDVVRDAMDASISAGDRAAWQTVRKQWAALKTVEPLVATKGNITPSLLMGRMTANGAGKSRMATDSSGKMGDLARIGSQFLKDAPNSGTADRALVNSLIGGGILGAQQTGVIDPSTAMWMGGALLGNRMALKALNSRALTAGGSAPVNGLARLLQTAPKALPATFSSPVPLTMAGGRMATPEDIARDEEIVRRFRERR